MHINFVSLAELTRDIRAFSAQLPPDVAAVAGIPRSGVLAASLLALHRNIPLVPFDSLPDGRVTEILSEVLTRTPGNPRRAIKHGGNKVLVLDDTVNTGQTFQHVWKQLQDCSIELVFGAVYNIEPSPEILSYRRVPQPRIFEWNLFHSYLTPSCIFDLDGVLCCDPQLLFGERLSGEAALEEMEADSGPGLSSFLYHLEHARPLHIPSVPVLAIATGRLEKYRPQTEAWLAKHGVNYQRLVMSPHPTRASRYAANDVSRMKAAVYTALPEAALFIESCERQADEIARFTGRPVLCADTMRML